MQTTDKNMLQAIDFLKESGEIRFLKEAYGVMGLDKIRIFKIKYSEKYDQEFHFTVEHIRLFCDYYNINSNYILGFESNFYRTENTKKAQMLLKT